MKDETMIDILANTFRAGMLSRGHGATKPVRESRNLPRLSPPVCWGSLTSRTPSQMNCQPKTHSAMVLCANQ